MMGAGDDDDDDEDNDGGGGSCRCDDDDGWLWWAKGWQLPWGSRTAVLALILSPVLLV